MVLYELQRYKIFCSFANILATKSKEFCKIKSFFQFAPTKIELTYCNSMAYSIFSTYFAPTFPLLCLYCTTTNYQPTTDQPPKCLTPAVLHLFTPTLLI